MRLASIIFSALMLVISGASVGIAEANATSSGARVVASAIHTHFDMPELGCTGLPSDFADDDPADTDDGSLNTEPGADPNGEFVDESDDVSPDDSGALVGTSEDEAFAGSEDNDVITGAGGDDDLCGEAGDDNLSGGDGNDLIDASAGNDTVTGDAGKDQLFGDDGDDNLSGGNSNDILSGGLGRDRFSGGAGNDRIDSDDGVREKIRCGTGKDLVYADRKDVVARDCERVK